MFYNQTNTHTAKFGRNTRIVRGEDLSDEQIASRCPSVFAETAHASRSERFTYLSTATILGALRSNGFQVTEARQGGSRDGGKLGFTKHLLRLRHASMLGGTVVPEIIAVNGHDGSSTLQFLQGCFNTVCCNGLIAGNFSGFKLRHSGRNYINDVINAAYEVVDENAKLPAMIEDLRSVELALAEAIAFGRAAASLRFAEQDIDLGLVNSILRPRRREDASNSLWDVFNRAQESLVNGGFLAYRSNLQTGKTIRAKVRPVNNIAQNTALNRSLWTLAEEMAKLKRS